MHREHARAGPPPRIVYSILPTTCTRLHIFPSVWSESNANPLGAPWQEYRFVGSASPAGRVVVDVHSLESDLLSTGAQAVCWTMGSFGSVKHNPPDPSTGGSGLRRHSNANVADWHVSPTSSVAYASRANCSRRGLCISLHIEPKTCPLSAGHSVRERGRPLTARDVGELGSYPPSPRGGEARYAANILDRLRLTGSS